jgi:hypothetical protein
MNIILFDKTGIYKEDTKETILYGSYVEPFTHITMEGNPIFYEKCPDRKDFYIKITGKRHVVDVVFHFTTHVEPYQCVVLYPMDRCDLTLTQNSAIISTMCKHYSHRLDEWIQYHLQLGFSGIVIFDNDDNLYNGLNESLINCQLTASTKDICDKYKGKVWRVHFPYRPRNGDHWNTIQSISLMVGTTAFRTKCRHIALIDADEFIYLPKSKSIELFLKDKHSISMKSNILTNKNKSDVIQNNVLQLAQFVGEDKYTKIILCTSDLKPFEFIANPHEHSSAILLPKYEIIHYHCWMNHRYPYYPLMPCFNGFLKN